MKLLLILIFFCLDGWASNSSDDDNSWMDNTNNENNKKKISLTNSSDSKKNKKKSTSSKSSSKSEEEIKENKISYNTTLNNSQENYSDLEIKNSVDSLILEVLTQLKLNDNEESPLKQWSINIDTNFKKYFYHNEEKFNYPEFPIKNTNFWEKYKKSVSLLKPTTDQPDFKGIKNTLRVKDLWIKLENYIPEHGQKIAGFFYKQIIDAYEEFIKNNEAENLNKEEKKDGDDNENLVPVDIPEEDNNKKNDNKSKTSWKNIGFYGVGIAAFFGIILWYKYFYLKKTNLQIPSVITPIISLTPNANVSTLNNILYEKNEEELKVGVEEEKEAAEPKEILQELHKKEIEPVVENKSVYAQASAYANATPDKTLDEQKAQKNSQITGITAPVGIALLLSILSLGYLSYEGKKQFKQQEKSLPKKILKGIALGVSVLCVGILIGNHFS